MKSWERRIQGLKEDIYSDSLSQKNREIDRLQAENREQQRVIDAQYKDIQRLKGACNNVVSVLRQLHDYQNGCPLPSYEQGWSKAMAGARECFRLYEGGEG
jgi:hypothetical protein